MKKVSLVKGMLFLLVGVLGASCAKDVQDPMETATVSDSTEVVTAASLGAVSATTTTTTTTSVGTPIGFATVNGMTTGGAGGKTVTVTTLSALKSAAGSTSPMIIKVSGIIKGNEGVTVRSNKTIIGLSGSKLDGPGLKMYNVSNIIVKNMTIINSSASDAITIKDRTHHVWIDHCTFSTPKYDGLVDITQESDYITISWSKFSNASLTSLVGGSETNTADKGKLRVTYHHNYFLNTLERSPSLSFGTGHVFNNYYEHTISYPVGQGYGIAARMGAHIYTENNYFRNIKGAPIVTIGTVLGYIGGASTNIYSSCAANKIKTSASSWRPSYSYKTQLIAASNVPTAVKAGAGAK
jgi:pectate lyase